MHMAPGRIELPLRAYQARVLPLNYGTFWHALMSMY